MLSESVSKDLEERLYLIFHVIPPNCKLVVYCLRNISNINERKINNTDAVCLDVLKSIKIKWYTFSFTWIEGKGKWEINMVATTDQTMSLFLVVFCAYAKSYSWKNLIAFSDFPEITKRKHNRSQSYLGTMRTKILFCIGIQGITPTRTQLPSYLLVTKWIWTKSLVRKES